MKKFLDCVSIILFFSVTVMIGISAVFFGGKADKPRSADSAREYVRESFPFRNNWSSLYSRVSKLMGTKQFGDIYLDDGGGRLIRVFSEYDEERTEKNISAINEFNEKHSKTPSYIMIAPTASGIYRDDLPDSLHAADQQRLIDDIYYAIDASVTPLDVFNALYSARDNYIYYRTDPYWTQQGAYEAYAASVSKLGSQPYSVANYDVDYTHVSYYGSLSRESGIRSVTADTVNAYRCKYGSYIRSTELLRDKQTYAKTSVYSPIGLRGENKYEYFLGGSDFKCARIETASEGKPTLLIICSDYANCFVPFLAPHYSEITMVVPERLSGGETLSDFADADDYDQTLFLYDVESFCRTEGFDRLD